MKTGTPTGTQIALLMFAVMLLAVPLSSRLAASLSVAEAHRELLGRVVQFIVGALVLVVVAPLRRAAAACLSEPIPKSKRLELALVSVGRIVIPLAVIGAAALWTWIAEGGAALEARMRSDPSSQWSYAFSIDAVILFLLIGGILAPVLEELLFRGFIYRAWEARWGWVPAMIGVSILFGLYHSQFTNAFLTSIVLVCLLRRTGSIWAPIAAHSFGNVVLWYPLAGRLLHPPPEEALGDITTWKLQLACLLVAVVWVPLYLWIARERPLARTVFLER